MATIRRPNGVMAINVEIPYIRGGSCPWWQLS